MSTFNFNGPVGQVQAGDNNTMNVDRPAGSVAVSGAGWDAERIGTVRDLAERLVEAVGRDHPHLRPHAEAVRAELTPAARAGASAPAALDTGRIRQRLELIAAGVGTGTAALTLVEGIVHAIGG